MATTKTGKNVVPYEAPTNSSAKRREADKPSDIVKRWIFPVVLLIAVIITWIVLFSTGMASGAFGVATYPLTLTTVVTVFHIVILLFPIVLILKKKAWLRLIAVAIMVLGPWLLLAVGYVHGMGAPLWGLRILGAVALILSAIAAYVLTRYIKEDQTLVHEVNSLPELKQSIADQRKKENDSEIQFQAAKDRSDQLEKESSDAVSLAEKSSKAYTKAKKDFDEHPLVVEQSDIKKDLAAKKAARDDIPNQQQAIRTTIAQSGGKNTRALEGQLAQLDQKYVDLDKEVTDLERKLKGINPKVDALNEKKVLDDATAKNKTDGEAQQDVRRELKVANKRLRRLTDDWKHEQAATARLVKQRDEVAAKQQSTKEERRLLWRDELFFPVVLAVVALLLYPAWYGWVATQVL